MKHEFSFSAFSPISQCLPMLYFILWVVFLVACVIALPVTSMMEKRKALSAMSPVEDSAFEPEEYEAGADGEPPAAGDAFGEVGEDFPAEEMPEAGEAVVDDFSAFDEEFK